MVQEMGKSLTRGPVLYKVVLSTELNFIWLQLHKLKARQASDKQKPTTYQVNHCLPWVFL